MSSFSIYQLATPNIDSYAQYSIASIKSYAERYGYDHYIQREQMEMDMHINWTKIALLTKALKKATTDYVVLLDADTVLVNPDLSLETFAPKGHQIVSFARDTPILKFHKPNAGFIILKANGQSLKMMEQWMTAAKGAGKKWADIHPRNQNVYWRYIEPQWKATQRLIPMPYCHKYIPMLLPLYRRHFLYHVTQSDVQERKKVMQTLSEKNVPDLARHLVQLNKQLIENVGLIKLN